MRTGFLRVPPGDNRRTVNEILDTHVQVCYYYFMMTRKHIFIPKDLNVQIQHMAKTANKSESQVIRELIEKGVGKKRPNAGDFLLKLATIGAKGPKDLSTNIDKYLYEDE